jgi:hypothetical protein
MVANSNIGVDAWGRKRYGVAVEAVAWTACRCWGAKDRTCLEVTEDMNMLHKALPETSQLQAALLQCWQNHRGHSSSSSGSSSRHCVQQLLREMLAVSFSMQHLGAYDPQKLASTNGTYDSV